MSTFRRDVFTGVSARIARRFHEVSKPYLDRNEPVPAGILDREFKRLCGDYEVRHGIKLDAGMREYILEKWVPRAADQWARRQQRKNEGIMA